MAWFGGAAAISVLLAVATAANMLYDADGLLAYVLRKFDLRLENNPAAAWSGMLLALVSAHAFDGYASERRHDRHAARAWALIALVLLALSADEVGSFHERVGRLGIGSWWPLLPPALVLGGMVTYASSLLWRDQADRRKVVQLLLGFVMLASAALYEFIGDRVELTAGAKVFRSVLEEGSELCGMLILLQVAMRNTAGLAAERTAGDAAFQAVRELRLLLAGSALVLAPFLAYVTAALTDHRGHPADWAAALLFFAAVLAACRSGFAVGASLGWHRWAICALCSLALVVAIDGDPHRVAEVGSLTIILRLLLLGIVAFLACALWGLDPHVDGQRFYTLGGILLVALALASLLPLDLFAVYLLTQLCGLAVYLAAAAAAEQADAAGRPDRR